MGEVTAISERKPTSVGSVDDLLAFLKRKSVDEISERDLAMLLIASFKRTIAFSAEAMSWCRFDWTTGKWILGADHYVADQASQLGGLLRKVARTTKDKDERRLLLAHAKKVESQRGLASVLYFAANHPDARVSGSGFDAKPAILGVKNGAFDIEKGEFFLPSTSDLVTKSFVPEFNPLATCPTWLAVLDRIVGDLPAEEKVAMIEFLQCVAGEMLIHNTCRRRFYFFGGPPGTGKSVFTNTLKDLLGPYGTALPPEALMTARNGGDVLRPELMSLPGARLLLLSEAGDGQCFDDDTIKRWTGGDPVIARGLHQNPVTFNVGALICLTGNSYPQSKTGGAAFMGRICIINFRNPVPAPEQDRDLTEKLKREYSGILNWALVGAMKVMPLSAVTLPRRVVEDTQRYRDTADHVKMFFKECCRDAESGTVLKSDLNRVYSAWCKENGYKALFGHRLNRRFEDMGYSEVRSKGRRGFRGFELTVDYEHHMGTTYRNELFAYRADDSDAEPVRVHTERKESTPDLRL
jgi:putative DNA primase/helicase